jgi:hypothetical protein
LEACVRSLVLIFVHVSFATASFAQYSTSDAIPLPPDKTDATFTLVFPTDVGKSAKVTLLPFLDANGVRISPQPLISEQTLNTGKLTVRVSRIYFWGEARLPVNVNGVPGAPFLYTLQRGPKITPVDIDVRQGDPAQLWLYNFSDLPVKLSWRIIAGTLSVCGFESDGRVRVDCEAPERWATATFGPLRSDPLKFALPDTWFHPWQLKAGDPRDIVLELRFGDGDSAPLQRVPLKAHLLASLTGSFLSGLGALLGIVFWVTLGAVLLMMAQVIVPNLRRCLAMETDMEGLQERLRAISSRVGGRLYSRCDQELKSVRTALRMDSKSSWLGPFIKLNLLLAGNTVEVSRLETVIARIKSRIRLTERLDQCLANELDSGRVPPSICWRRAVQLKNVQDILSSQLITEADEKSATASLDLAYDTSASKKDLAVELETRIAGLRRQLSLKPWDTKREPWIKDLNGCKELLEEKPGAIPAGGWSDEELSLRDLNAIRLTIVLELLAIECLVVAQPDLQAELRKILCSKDPAKLAEARQKLLMLSQGISEATVQAALEAGMWDSYSEPVSLTNQDVLRASMKLRDSNLDKSFAKERFQCSWAITITEGNQPSEVSENGWEVQLILPIGSARLTPDVYDFGGKKIAIRPDPTTEKTKGVLDYSVAPNDPIAVTARLIRGLVDAMITASVPVLTVAITQFQTNSTNLTPYTLILLGFTSQAVRAAIIPESTSATTAPAKSGT